MCEVLERFQRDIASHAMTVLRDDGVYRHLRFARPGTSCMHFELITWPGYLAYVGDMGAFTFQRLVDMFEFFRLQSGEDDDLYRWIDKRYWAEKLEAVDRRGGQEEWDADEFKAHLRAERRRIVLGVTRKWSREQRRALWEEWQDVIDINNEGEAIVAVQQFSFTNYQTSETVSIPTDDFPMCRKHTLRFTWCCYALRWAIAKYDSQKVAVPA